MARPKIESKMKYSFEQAKSYLSKKNIGILANAFELLTQYCETLGKQVGEEFLDHSLEMVETLTRLRMDPSSLVAGMMHQAVERNLITPTQLEEQFGSDTANLVKHINKLSAFTLRSHEAQRVQSFRNMFLAMASDIRVLIVKLADRLQILHFFGGDSTLPKAREIAEETLNIYAPIASRLGIQWLKMQMEDLCFQLIDPDEFDEVHQYLDGQQLESRRHIDHVVQHLQNLTDEHGISCEIYGRTKHHYSIRRKMERKNLDLDQIYDIIAFRVLVDDVEQCYRVLGFIHAEWQPIRGMFDDYIAMPKPNGYQSLHTAVLGSSGERMEIQIRTRTMHEVAENGIAAHWRYKEGGGARAYNPKEDSQIAWLRRLIEVKAEAEDSSSMLDRLRMDLFSGFVYVFTPAGDVHELPSGACSLDFAFSVHTEVGLRCNGAKVNGKMEPLHHKLASGDVVEILTSKNRKPKKEWLDFVKTTKAKNKIRHAIGAENRTLSRELGRQLCEKEFKALGLNFNHLCKENKFSDTLEKLKLRDTDELLLRIGRAELAVLDFIEHLAPDAIPQEEPDPELPPLPPKKRRRSKSGIRIAGFDDFLIRFGRCCNPIQGDNIVGFVTRGRGVTIHRSNCKKLPKDEPGRILEAYWDMEAEIIDPITLRVISYDNPGLMTKMSAVFSTNKINIDSLSANSQDGRATATFVTRIRSLEELEKIRRELRKLKGVLYVERVKEYY